MNANMWLTGFYTFRQLFPDKIFSLTFSKIPDISLTAVKFPDISRFSRQVVTQFTVNRNTCNSSIHKMKFNTNSNINSSSKISSHHFSIYRPNV